MREAFSDKTDAQEALESGTAVRGFSVRLRGMDGKSLDGQTITVSKAGPEPHTWPSRDLLGPSPHIDLKQIPTKTSRRSGCASMLGPARFL